MVSATGASASASTSTSTSDTLLSKLESSNPAGLHRRISDYLNPFADLRKPNRKGHETLLRSLAKSFTPFLNAAVNLLHKRLADPSKLDSNFAPELLDIYRLCLDSMDAVSSEFSGKPYKFHVQRIRLVYVFMAWSRHKDAEAEALRVLKSFKAIQLGPTPVDLDLRFVPGVEQGSADKEFGALIGELVWLLVKCASLIQSKEDEVYERLLCMVQELTPWFRVLDETVQDKVHKQLAIYFERCTQFLVREELSANLACKFCRITISEHAKSSTRDQMYKCARRICANLFSLKETRSSVISDTFICLLDSLVDAWKAAVEDSGKDFVELIAFCAIKCRTANTILSGTMRSHLKKLISHFNQVPPLNLILRLYATGLHYVDHSIKSKDEDLTSSGDPIRILVDDGVTLTDLSDCLDSLESYFEIGTNEISQNGFSTSHVHKELKESLLPYFCALEFLCDPLADIVYSGKNQIFADNGAASVSSELCVIQGAFHRLYDVFLSLQTYRITCEIDIDEFKYNSILRSSVAAFILFARTRLNMQKSAQILNHIISSEWIQLDGLKYLYVSLYNTGTRLYNNKKLNEASEAMKLSCKASWNRVIRLCALFAGKSKVSSTELSEDAILDVLNDSCARSAFLLDILNQVDNQGVKVAMTECLETWSTAASLFGKLPGPMSVVKQWVKMECKWCNNLHIEDTVPTLFSLLSSSKKISKKTTEIILEQGLLAYEKMYVMNPEFCQKMQMQIINILQQHVYVTPDSWLQKARILVRKGRALKRHGIKGVKDCINCLSEAISSFKQSKIYDKASIHQTSPRHELAVAYCLRALCTQEDEPQSETMFEDIRTALDTWLGISPTDMSSPDDKCSPPDEKCFLVSENTMMLLYNIMDLLSIKGHIGYYEDIYRILIRLFKWKNIPLERCLVRLWECRRSSHSLCTSPVNDALIMNLSDHFGDLSKSIDFWIDCLKGSQQLVIGFQHYFSFLFANLPWGPCNRETMFRYEITVEEVKEAALGLISQVPVSSQSAYAAAYLYYDLCERLVSNGQLVEALSYAMEAHQLRLDLFKKKFVYSYVQKAEKYNETSDTYQKFTLGDGLEVQRSIARDVWSFDTSSCDLENFYLGPYNVLQCYLESTLQVGVIHERLGNAAEAEVVLQWGKTISCSQSLPLFTVAFCSVLGKMYHGKQLWDLAEKELQSAEQCLKASKKDKDISCLKCRWMQEATVELNLGDLYQSKFYSSKRAPERFYKSALTKLSEWESSASCPGQTVLKKVGYAVGSTSSHFSEFNVEPKGKIEAKKSRTKNVRKPVERGPGSVPEYNLRSTRSRCQSSQNQGVTGTGVQVGHSKDLKRSSECDSSDNSDFFLDLKSCGISYDCDLTCICNKMRCWYCLPMEVRESGLLKNFVDLKWDYVRRRLSLRLLTGLVNCLENQGLIHDTEDCILQSISILVSRNPFCLENQGLIHETTSLICLLDLMAKEIPGDVLSVERAETLYSICWLYLKIRSKNTRIIFSGLPQIHLPKLVSWLMLAFVLCREVPILFQKVSRLLAAIFSLSASSELLPLSSSCKDLHDNHWASYFHQASIGMHLNYKPSGRCKPQHLIYRKGEHVAGSCLVSETQNLHRVAPESIQDLEDSVMKFFSGLPCTTIICISVLGGPYASLLQELMCFPSRVLAWTLVSRLNSKNQPTSMLLPVESALEDIDDASFSGMKDWHCPWGSTVVDDVAPEFRLILEGMRSSSLLHRAQDTDEKRLNWWVHRKNFDRRLGTFLKNLEDSWFGTWKLMLLGEWSNCKQLDLVHKKLVRNLKSKCKMEIDESLLKGFNYARVAQLCHKKGSYVSRIGCLEEEECMTSCNDSNGGENLSELASKLVLEAGNELEGLHSSVTIEPTILVVDYEVQMLPWENLPILRNQEVYRMPSVGCILATAYRNCHNQDHAQSIVTSIPLIDPLDAFYLLNPSGDLNNTQNEFEAWFRDQNLEGKTGYAPAAEELAVALKSHDLFMYFGHGCGSQYIPRRVIQRLEDCAATLLMGCSSGCLKLNGCYAPQGTPLSYLQAGSPVIVANLWDVTDKDIDRFSKSMIDSWLKARSSPCEACSQRKKKVSKKLATNLACEHRPKVGSFMSEARETCQLPFLIGAAPVCYGVPTGIWKKEL